MSKYVDRQGYLNDDWLKRLLKLELNNESMDATKETVMNRNCVTIEKITFYEKPIAFLRP